MNSIRQLSRKYGAELTFNTELSGFTSFKIGGPCTAMLRVNSSECLHEAICVCKSENIRFLVLGRGSNVLFSENGFDGLIILLGSEFSEITVNGNEIVCQAGATLLSVCLKARDFGLAGLEFAYGIPGTVGGALFMNAGAYGGEMKNVVSSCRFIDENGNENTLSANDMKLSYRSSIFSQRKYVISEVTFMLSEADRTTITERMNELMERRRSKQPLEYPSAGSTFKRPEGDFASRLIEASGLKGFTCGGAQVSEKHSGFVINKYDATFDDVMNVINGVKEKVKQDSGIALECEVIIIDR